MSGRDNRAKREHTTESPLEENNANDNDLICPSDHDNCHQHHAEEGAAREKRTNDLEPESKQIEIWPENKLVSMAVDCSESKYVDSGKSNSHGLQQKTLYIETESITNEHLLLGQGRRWGTHRWGTTTNLGVLSAEALHLGVLVGSLKHCKSNDCTHIS